MYPHTDIKLRWVKGVSLIIYERLFTAHQIDRWGWMAGWGALLCIGPLVVHIESYNKDCYKTINEKGKVSLWWPHQLFTSTLSGGYIAIYRQLYAETMENWLKLVSICSLFFPSPPTDWLPLIVRSMPATYVGFFVLIDSLLWGEQPIWLRKCETFITRGREKHDLGFSWDFGRQNATIKRGPKVCVCMLYNTITGALDYFVSSRGEKKGKSSLNENSFSLRMNLSVYLFIFRNSNESVPLAQVYSL